MLLDVAGVAGVADTMWTLSYEMVFYLLVTALFMLRWHDRSGLLAMLFAAGSVVVGLVMSRAVLGGGWVAYTSCAVFAAGLACLITGRFRRTAGYVLGVMALVMLVLNSRVPWLGVAVVALMFAGTAIYRWERGEGGLWPVAVTAALVGLALSGRSCPAGGGSSRTCGSPRSCWRPPRSRAAWRCAAGGCLACRPGSG